MTLALQAQGLRRSQKRERIYEYLCQSTQHPSAETIYQALRQDIKDLSLGTVYRNLAQLEQLGHIQRVTALDSSERYDARCDTHGHFVCTQCGAIVDLDPINGQQLAMLSGLQDGFAIHRTDITFHGQCAQCACMKQAP